VVREVASAASVTFHGGEFLEVAEGSGILAGFLDLWHAEVVCNLADFDGLAGRVYAYQHDGFGETDRADLRRLFNHLDRARILCLTRVRATGADRINAALHRRAQVARPSGRGDDLIAGEPVMMLRNDYGRMIYNGDQGLVLRVSEGGGRPALMVVFPREEGFVAYRTEALRPHLIHSYALTVHKAQGSEYDHVALVLPDADIPINAREILYTALTRARTSVTILGSREVFARGVARRIHRSSGLAEMLRQPDAAGNPN
jgi:exodeoxyribonuclease V alpha subunit